MVAQLTYPAPLDLVSQSPKRFSSAQARDGHGVLFSSSPFIKGTTRDPMRIMTVRSCRDIDLMHDGKEQVPKMLVEMEDGSSLY
jgi:hypothetical protein